MVRACPNQNVTLAYLVCVHVAVRGPIHRDLLSPSTLWVLRLSICPAICTLACPSICLSAGLFCVPSVCPSLCPIVHSHASHGRPPVLWILCLPPCAFHLLVPLSVACPCLSLSIPYILHLCTRSCVPLFVWSTPPASVSSLSSIPTFPSTSVALTASDVPCLLSSGDALLTPTG